MKMARGVTVIVNGQHQGGAARVEPSEPGMKTRRPGSATLSEETLPYRVA